MTYTLILFAAVLYTALLFIYIVVDDGDNILIFAGVLTTLALVLLTLGKDSYQEREYNYKIKPTVHVECHGKKCDTTYIYKFKQDER